MTQRFTRIAQVAAVALGLAMPGVATAQVDKTQLVVGQLQFLTNFHPLIQVNNTKRITIAYGLRPITGFDDTGTNLCILCTRLPSIDNGLAKIVDLPDGKKGMTVQFTLRQGLGWGDGTPVTTKDVAFTWKMATDPKIGFSNYNPWDRASKVEIVDDRTFILHLPTVISSFASWDQLLPEHIEGPIYAANPEVESYAKQTMYNRNPATPGLWNGSFMLTDYRAGTRIMFEPNPHWPSPKPHLKRIILTYRDNSSSLVQNLLSGGIDAVPVSPGGISFSEMLDLRRQYPNRFTYHIAYGTNLERIALNFDNPILADVRVRRAIMHAINRDEITKALFDGLQSSAISLVSEESPLFNKDITRYPFDPATSKKLLAEAGWKPGPGGICVNGSGQKLSLDFVTTAGNQTRSQIAQVIQAQMKDICVETVTKLVGLSEYNGVLSRQRTFKGMIMSSIDFSPSASPRIALGSDQIPTEANNRVGNNFSGYSSKAMDDALTVLEKSLSEKEEKAGWALVQKEFTADLPILPLYFYARSYVTTRDVKDFPQGALDPLSNWAEQWRRE